MGFSLVLTVGSFLCTDPSTINMNNKPIYDIVYEQDFNQLTKELEPFEIQDKKLCIITDSRVKGFYADEVRDALKDHCKEIFVYDFPDGEQSKNLDTVRNIYTFLIQNKLTEKICCWRSAEVW